MKKFISYLIDFHKDYYNTLLYAIVLLYIGILIAINYTFNLENGHIDQYAGKPIRILMFFGVHAVAYYGVMLIIYLFDKKRIKFSWQFWLKSLLGFLIIASDRSIFTSLYDLLLSDVAFEIRRFCSKILVNSYGFVTILGSMTILTVLFDRKAKEGVYGLRFGKVDFKAYFIMLLIMIPIVYAASWLPDFIKYYPTYKRCGGARFAEYFGINEVISKVVYEFFYIGDFLNTELFFRGFLIIGLSRLMGKNTILPMAATYAALHFGKPIGETISSIFGGYILGIIALYSRNIWGGVFVHGGIALLMEIFAFIRIK